MKKLILLLGISISLVGCSKGSDTVVYDYNSKILSNNQINKNSIEIKTNSTRFIETGNVYSILNDSWYEVLDTLTGNLYIGKSSLYQAGLSPLYNENGEIMNINNK